MLSTPVSLLLVLAEDPAPEPNDVVAGWTAFGLFLLLLLAIFLLGRSLRTRLRNVDAAEENGLYDEPGPRDRVSRAQREAHARGIRSAPLPQDGDDDPDR